MSAVDNGQVGAFMLGVAVANHVGGVPRGADNVKAVKACLREIASGDLTLVDSTAEIAKGLPVIPDDVKEQLTEALNTDPEKLRDRLMQEVLRQARTAHQEIAMYLLDEMKRLRTVNGVEFPEE